MTTIEAIGKSGKFRLKNGDDQWIHISQSKVVEVDSTDKIVSTWNLASGDDKEFVNIDTPPSEGLICKQFTTSRRGKGASTSSTTKFELMLTYNETDASITYTDAFTNQDVTIDKYSLKFSIKLTDWEYINNSRIWYEIVMVDQTGSGVMDQTGSGVDGVDGVDGDVVISLPSGMMVVPTTTVYGDTEGPAITTTVNDNIIKFEFDVSSKPKIIAYDPTISLIDNMVQDVQCECDQYSYVPVMNQDTSVEYSNLCSAICTGNEDPNDLVSITHEPSTFNGGGFNFMVFGSIICIIFLLFIITYLIYF